MERKPNPDLTISVRSKPPPSVTPMFDIVPHPIGEPQGPWPPRTYKVSKNSNVTITAPEKIYTGGIVPEPFQHWHGNAKGSSPKITIAMEESDKKIIACYVKTFKLSISAYPPHTVRGRFSLKPRPHLSPPPMPYAGGTYLYDEGTQVAFSAPEDTPGWKFDHWEWGRDLTSSKNPDTVTMDSDKSVIAYYKEGPVTYPPPIVK